MITVSLIVGGMLIWRTEFPVFLSDTRKKSFGIERTAAIETGRETLIEIDKDGKGLGLSIVGGSDTVLGTVVIHEVYPDGAAAHDGRLKPGDQVLEVSISGAYEFSFIHS
ncbi:hypothetical protein COOONC_20135 [Cooperia oncophora]